MNANTSGFVDTDTPVSSAERRPGGLIAGHSPAPAVYRTCRGGTTGGRGKGVTPAKMPRCFVLWRGTAGAVFAAMGSATIARETLFVGVAAEVPAARGEH